MNQEETKTLEKNVLTGAILTPGEIACVRKHLPKLYKRLRRSTQPVRPRNKTGRNEPCPCLSGKKYKKCCMIQPEPIPEGVIVKDEPEAQAVSDE